MIIFKINYNKKIGKNNKGHIIARHRETGTKTLYIPLDLNYFNCRRTNTFKIQLLTIKTNYMYRNTKLVLGICTAGYLKGESRYLLKPCNITYGDIIQFSDKSNKHVGNINCLVNFEINDKIYNLEFNPNAHSKICTSAECNSVLLVCKLLYSVVQLPSNKTKSLNNKCYVFYGKTEKIDTSFNKNAGTMRHLGHRPKVRGSAMNACDHPHGGGEGKAPIGRKYICSFKGRNTKGVKTVIFKK